MTTESDADEPAPGGKTRDGPDDLLPEDILPGVIGADVVSRSSLQRGAVRGSLATALNVFLSVPTAAVATAVVARLLKPSAYGLLAYLTIATTIAISVTDGGLTSSLVQWGAAAESKGNVDESRFLLSSGTGYRLFVQLPLLAVFGLILLHSQPAWIQETYLLAIVITVPVYGGYTALSTQNRTASLAVLAIIGNIGVQVVVVLAAWRLRTPGPVWVLRLAVGAVIPLFSLALLNRPYRRAVLIPRIPRNMPVGFWRFSALMWAAGLVTLLVYSRSEVFVLRYYGQARNLGVFALAFGLSQQLTAPVDAMLGPLLPASAALLSAHPDHAYRAMIRGLRFSSLVCGGIAAVLLPALYFVVPTVYGSSFAGVSSLFLVLGLVSTLQSVFSPVNALLIARRRAKILLGIACVTVFIDALVAIVLIPPLGAWGAVIANVLAQVVSSLMLARAEFRIQGIRSMQGLIAARAWFLGAASLAVAFIVGAALAGALGPLKAPLVATVGALTYVLLIRGAGGVLEQDDQAALIAALPTRLKAVGTFLVSQVAVRDRWHRA